VSEHEREESGQPSEAGEEPSGRPEGEDHREGAPGYDLDEQSAIRELMDERDGEAEGEERE
jgi:hypothetical protein